MTPTIIAALILLIGLIVLIALSVPIGVAIGISAFLATVAMTGTDQGVLASAQRTFTGMNSFTLLAIPFFVLAGGLMNSGGIAGRLVDAAKVVVGKMPGGLAHTNTVANTMFGAVSGAAVAAAAAVGTVMGPRMEKDGYNKAFAAAVNVASAPAGMLIPPSNIFIVYSLVSSTSIAALFLAGIGPGLLWAFTCMVVTSLLLKKYSSKNQREHLTLKIAAWAIWRAIPSLAMIVIVVGGILAGYFTPTEASAIAVVYCLILGFAYREIKIKDLPGILLEAAKTTGIVMLLIGVSTSLSFIMSFAQIPDLIGRLLTSVSDSHIVIMIIMMLIMLIVGTFMDPTPAILIFTPIFLPLVTAMGYNPIHFGTMMVFNLCVGVITPPVGNVLFVGSRIAGMKIEPVIKALWPFMIGLIGALFIVVFVPALSMFIPTMAGFA